jgi:hypothetical protein
MMFAVLAMVAVLSAGIPQVPAQLPVPDPAAPQQAPVPAPTVDPDAIGISLGRIQKAVTKPQAIKLTENRRVFRVEVFGENPTIIDILGPDYLRGPVPNAGMTHQEFLNMVTPKDVQGYAAFTNQQGMVVAATSIALQWALQKALDKYREARNDRAKAAATREVQEALDALRKARREAGLPDK